MDAKQAIWEAMGWAEDADPITPTMPSNPLTPSTPGANPASPASPASGGAGGKSVGEMLSELEKHDKQSHRGGYKGGKCIYRAKLAQAGYDMAAHDAKLGNFVPSDPSEYGNPDEEEDASDAETNKEDPADNPVPLEQPVEKTIGDIELTAKTEGAAVALEALEKIVRDPNGDPELVAKAQEALFRLSQDPSVQKEPPAAQSEAAAATTEPTGGAELSPDVPRDIPMTDDEFAKLMSDESAAAAINAEIAEYKDALKVWAKEGALPGPDYIINPTSLQGRMVAKALEEVTQELSAPPSEGGLIGKPISDSDFEQMKQDVVLGGVVKKTRDFIKAQLEQASKNGEPVSFPFEKGTLEDRLLEEVKAEIRGQGLKLKDEGETQPPESTEGPTPEKTAEPEKPDADGEEVKEGAESQKSEVDADGVEYDDISIEASTPEEGGELPTTSPDEAETATGGPATGTSGPHPVSKLSEQERSEAWDALGQSFRDAIMAIKGDKDDATIDSLINKIAVIGQKRKIWAQTKDVTPSRQSVRDSLNKVLDEDVEQSKDETTLDRMNKFIKDPKIPREIRDIITSLRDRLQDPFISNANKLKTLEKFASVVKKNKLDEGGGTKEGTVPGYVDDGDDNHRTGGVTSSEKMSDKPAVFKVDPNNSKITAGKYNQEKEAVDKVTDDAAQFGIDPSDINVKRKVNTTEISIGLPDNITDADVKRLKDQLAAKFPGLRTTEVNDGPGQKKTVVENVFFIHDPYNQTLTVRMHNDVKGNVPHAALVNSDKFKEALAKGQVAATFAANDKGEPIIIDFRELPHIMFAGTSGAGKNARMDATITSLMAGKSPRDVQFLFVDGKGGGASFGKYKNSPYALLPVTDRQGAIQRVNFLINEMNNRDKLFNRLGVEDLKEYNEKMDQLVAEGKAPEGMPTHLPDIFLSIDEFGNVRNTLGAKKFDAAVAQLGNQGRSTGCHLMLATQNPTDEGGVSPNLKANLSTIVGMRTTNSIASHSILGETGLESLSKKGPVAIKTDEGVQYADGSYISNSEIAGGLPIKENPPETAKPIPTEIAKTPAEEAALNNIMGSIGNGKGVKVAEGRAAEMTRQYIQSIGLEYEEQKTADGKVLIKAKPLHENKPKGSASGEPEKEPTPAEAAKEATQAETGAETSAEGAPSDVESESTGNSETAGTSETTEEGGTAQTPSPFEQQVAAESESFSGDKQRFAVAHGAFSEAVASAKAALQRALASAKSDKAKVEAYHKHDMAIAQALANLNAYRNQVGLPSAELHEGVVSLPQPDAGEEETPAETASEAKPNAFLNEEVKNSLGSDLQKAEYDSAARSANNAYQTYLSALGGDDDKAKDEALKGYQDAVSRLNGILSKNGHPEIDVETGKSRTPTEPATATEVSESAEATQEPQVEPTSEDMEGYFDSDETTSIKNPVLKDRIESNAQALKKAYDKFNKAPKNSDEREKAGDEFLKLLKSDNVLRKKLKLRQRDEDGTLQPSEQPVTGEETQTQENAPVTVSQPNQYLVQSELQGLSEFNKRLLTRAAQVFQKANDTFSNALESDGTLDVDKAIKKYDKAVSAYNKIREGMGLKPVNRETGFAEGVKPDNKGSDKPTDPDQPPKGPDNPTDPDQPPKGPDNPTGPAAPSTGSPSPDDNGAPTPSSDNPQEPEAPEKSDTPTGGGEKDAAKGTIATNLPEKAYADMDSAEIKGYVDDVAKYAQEHKDGSSVIFPSKDEKNLVAVGEDAEKMAKAFGGQAIDKDGTKVFMVPDSAETRAKIGEIGKFSLPKRGPGVTKQNSSALESMFYGSHADDKFPIDQIKIPDTQFKLGADPKTGVVPGNELNGEWNDSTSSPITLYRRKDGTVEIVTGRHRLDLAKRSGLKNIPARIFEESEGYTPEDMRMHDAISNIENGDGTIEDYVNFFEQENVDEEKAKRLGLISKDLKNSRSKGLLAYSIVNNATPDLRASINWVDGNDKGKIAAETAGVIATVAPAKGGEKNKAIQKVLLGEALKGATKKSIERLGHDLQSVDLSRLVPQSKNKFVQTDFFETDVGRQIIDVMKRRDDYKTAKENYYKALSRDLSRARTRSDNLNITEKMMKELGITDKHDMQQLAEARKKAAELAEYWGSNHISAEDVAKMNKELGISNSDAPELQLESLTPQETGEEAKRIATQEKTKAQQESMQNAINAPLQGGKGDLGQADLFKPDGDDLFNNAQNNTTSNTTTTNNSSASESSKNASASTNANLQALKDNYDKAVKDHGKDSKEARDAKAAMEETTKRLAAAQNTVNNNQGKTTGEQKAPPVAAPTGKKPPAKTGSKPKVPTNGDVQGVKLKMNYLSDPSPAESSAMINEIKKLAGQDSNFRAAKKQKDALVKARQAETDPVKQQSLDAEIAKAEAKRISLLREIGNQLVGPRGLTLNEKGRIVVDRTAAENKIQQGLESEKKKSRKAKATTDEMPTENVWNDLFLAAFHSFQEGEKTSSGLV